MSSAEIVEWQRAETQKINKWNLVIIKNISPLNFKRGLTCLVVIDGRQDACQKM